MLGLLHMPGLPRDPTAPPPLEAILLPPPAPPAPIAPPHPAPVAPKRAPAARAEPAPTAHFDRAAGTLVFEGRGKQEPLPAAGQDRFSVFLQLVGLVRGNPQRYATPGATETFDVADTRDLEPMQVQYVGDEDVDTGHGTVRAKHFVRLPRHANDRRRVEVWLAQPLQWMPVKLRQTEPDGTQIELVYRDSESLH
ncbi:hypothetical protein OR16_28384 [Cupriavidus basilensis OR16]|uniref:DUF3108 domain-containing protein n=1 Tax=Cupriavidus basilensis OR16 TaxID=1127483 RepID=H1SBV5_9BURK|nr:hypothetical protein OR16_28384 [Cupriavidus basilensis OR16]